MADDQLVADLQQALDTFTAGFADLRKAVEALAGSTPAETPAAPAETPVEPAPAVAPVDEAPAAAPPTSDDSLNTSQQDIVAAPPVEETPAEPTPADAAASAEDPAAPSTEGL